MQQLRAATQGAEPECERGVVQGGRVQEDALLGEDVHIRPGRPDAEVCRGIQVSVFKITQQTAYKVAISPRWNLPYKHIYFTNDEKSL